ncbi:MAG: hypothetical protein GF400_07715 [Candidatus Eisenbacteria bacterium]|nr:hypothetical protein [Candidatus Eisenbacteria bacterium]
MRAERRFRPTREVGAGLALLATILLALAAPPALAADRPGEWKTLDAGEAAILYHRGDEAYATRVKAVYEARAPEIAASMGLTTLSPLRIIIASTDEEFAQVAYLGAPDWGVGCALPGQGLVVLKSPRIVAYPLQMETVVEHELAHIAAGRVLRGVDVPRWFDEGLAQAVAGEWRLSQSGALAAAAASGKLPPISSLEGGFPRASEAAAMAYAMSFQAMRLLLERSGMNEPGELVAAIREEGDFDRALATLTGLDRSEFDREYERFISRRFTWATMLNDGRWLFLLGAAVFIVVAVVRIRRARAKMRSWEEEEKSGRATAGATPGAGDSRWD